MRPTTGQNTVSAMPSLKDASLETIHFNDEFRRAKRNALLWSLVALLAALGSPTSREGSDDQVLVSIYPLGIGFSQPVLIILALAISTFMLVGYKRAREVVILHSSESLRNTGYREFDMLLKVRASAIRESIGKGSEVVSRLSALDGFQSKIETALTNYHDALENFMKKDAKMVREAVNDFPLQLEYYPEDGDPPPTKEKIKEVQSNLESQQGHIMSYFNNMEWGFRHIAEEYIKPLSEIPLPKQLSPFPAADTLTSQLDQVECLINGLRRFHHQIGEADKNWLALYDDAPVAALYILAVVAAEFTLFAP